MLDTPLYGGECEGMETGEIVTYRLLSPEGRAAAGCLAIGHTGGHSAPVYYWSTRCS